MKLVRLFIFFWCCCISTSVNAEVVTVAVASNFSAPMKQIAKEFQKQTGHRIRLVFGSSGKFYAQIINGAPFHIFFSADQAKPKALENTAFAVKGSRHTYAIGRLVLWSVTKKVGIKEAAILKNGQFRKLAIANARLAPYGVAAAEAIRGLGLEKSTKLKLVRGENITQTYQFVATGNADVGFVAYSQVKFTSQGVKWLVPETLHSPIKQDLILLEKGKSNKAALALLKFIRDKKIRAMIETYGYKTTVSKALN